MAGNRKPDTDTEAAPVPDDLEGLPTQVPHLNSAPGYGGLLDRARGVWRRQGWYLTRRTIEEQVNALRAFITLGTVQEEWTRQKTRIQPENLARIQEEEAAKIRTNAGRQRAEEREAERRLRLAEGRIKHVDTELQLEKAKLEAELQAVQKSTRDIVEKDENRLTPEDAEQKYLELTQKLASLQAEWEKKKSKGEITEEEEEIMEARKELLMAQKDRTREQVLP